MATKNASLHIYVLRSIYTIVSVCNAGNKAIGRKFWYLALRFHVSVKSRLSRSSFRVTIQAVKLCYRNGTKVWKIGPWGPGNTFTAEPLIFPPAEIAT